MALKTKNSKERSDFRTYLFRVYFFSVMFLFMPSCALGAHCSQNNVRGNTDEVRYCFK